MVVLGRAVPRTPRERTAMSDDSFEYEFLFRLQIRGRSRQADSYGGPRYRASLPSKARTVAKRFSAASAGRAWARYDVGETASNSRPCVVKSHYVSMLPRRPRRGRFAPGVPRARWRRARWLARAALRRRRHLRLGGLRVAAEGREAAVPFHRLGRGQMSPRDIQELRALVADEVRRVLADATPQPARVFTTQEAARYVGFRSAAAIRKARLEGRLVSLGRRGGLRSLDVRTRGAR